MELSTATSWSCRLYPGYCASAKRRTDISISELARHISTDTALSARLIKVVNSPLLRSRQGITDLNMAVNRLGVVYTANLFQRLASSHPQH